MTFTKWLETFCEEKGFDMDRGFTVEGPSGANHMTYEVVAQAMKSAPAHEQAKIKATLVKIDFLNGDCLHFFRHLAQAIAI